MANPIISIVMSVYNGEKFLNMAVNSILKQTFKNFEFIIINDGSTDKTAQILKQIRNQDKRVTIIEQENKGLIHSLNTASLLASGKYIARMDCDDICSPLRLAKQLFFLEKHPDIGILGAQAVSINENGRQQHKIYIPCTSKAIEWSLHFTNPIIHSVVLMRSEVIRALDYYNYKACHAEDYDLWVRALKITKIANLPDILIQKRFWPGNICSLYQELQYKTIIKIMHKVIEKKLNFKIDHDMIKDLHQFDISNYNSDNFQKIKDITDLTMSLYLKYKNDYKLSRAELKRN